MPDNPSAIAFTPVKPTEAIRFLKDKVPVTRDQFDRLSEVAKARAFTVSGLARVDMVEAVHRSMTLAMEKGVPLREWKQTVSQALDTAGFTGDRPLRLETIFRTNVQSAYMAGRYAEMSAMADTFPYWQYSAVNDGRTRPAHRALSGKVYPAGHPFWDTWFPPNGFNCRCTVKALTRRQVEDRGLAVETEIPEELDTASGPVRIAPDLGFSTNVGKDWLGSLTPGPLADEITPLVSRAICRQGLAFASGDDPCRPPLAGLDPRHVLTVDAADILPAGLVPERYVQAFLSEFGMADIEASKVVTLPGVELPMVVGKGFFIDKRTGEWKVNKSGRAPYVRLLAQTILNPYEVWQVPAEVSGKPMDTLRLLRLFSLDGKRIGGFSVFNLVRGRQWQAATAFTPKATAASEARMLEYLEAQRVGILAYREELKEGEAP
ncbi:phage head morphogenesis protein, SPP1 gp7 family [Solidesulfovibrio carbinoliphilus subsp. oakridgensis]|uniref:Phage head morphogenesis protein, SPP1 gp7 family n=1 Tax=Solidesulfovibrio carbinoliphilus subsp. oakridgensis TaxID=694327 RepID=G7QD38_9BACT|nr:phage minor head protein [Solidesulfovibrio carbinoliphilus]EHJ46344.1 phage head morphogenesis protein, SPP1 gp7 family [Solidesulfovibrio carbinoliphilus subsp. oakridgensis]